MPEQGCRQQSCGRMQTDLSAIQVRAGRSTTAIVRARSAALGAARRQPLSISDGGWGPDTFGAGYRRAELAILSAWRAVTLLAAPSVRRCHGAVPIRSNAEQSPPNKLRGRGFPAELHITAERNRSG